MDLPIAFQVVMVLEGRRGFATDACALRAGARVILEQGRRRGLLAFRIADTHVHALLCCTRAEASMFARSVACSLRWRLLLGARFGRSHFEPVDRQSQLAPAFFDVLRKEPRHGVGMDPMEDGSSLLDTLGLRLVDAELPQRVWAALPRLRREEVIDMLGPPGLALRAVDGAAPLDELAAAATAAFALGQLDKRSPDAIRARQGAQHLARQHGRSSEEIAALLGVTSRTVQLSARRPWVAGDVAAIRGQAVFREAVAKHEGAFVPDEAFVGALHLGDGYFARPGDVRAGGTRQTDQLVQR